MSEFDWIDGGVRLFKMSVELHRRGYQRLEVYPYEYPLAWRFEIRPRQIVDGVGREAEPVRSISHAEPARHSSANGLRYFDWDGVDKLDAEQLATAFMKRMPDLCEAGAGRDWEYAGWLSELSGHLSRTRLLPFLFSEYEDPASDGYLALRDYERGGEGSRFPLPPVRTTTVETLTAERDQLRNALRALKLKLTSAIESLRDI